MQTKPLTEVKKRIKDIEFHEEFDLIVAVARGGIIPAVLLQARLGCDLEWIWINFRDDSQKPIHEKPVLLKPLTFDPNGKKILLVDDRANSGSTLAVAKTYLKDALLVRTLVVNGAADYPLFNDECFYFPWRMDIPQEN